MRKAKLMEQLGEIMSAAGSCAVSALSCAEPNCRIRATSHAGAVPCRAAFQEACEPPWPSRMTTDGTRCIKSTGSPCRLQIRCIESTEHMHWAVADCRHGIQYQPCTLIYGPFLLYNPKVNALSPFAHMFVQRHTRHCWSSPQTTSVNAPE